MWIVRVNQLRAPVLSHCQLPSPPLIDHSNWLLALSIFFQADFKLPFSSYIRRQCKWEQYNGRGKKNLILIVQQNHCITFSMRLFFFLRSPQPLILSMSAVTQQHRRALVTNSYRWILQYFCGGKQQRNRSTRTALSFIFWFCLVLFFFIDTNNFSITLRHPAHWRLPWMGTAAVGLGGRWRYFMCSSSKMIVTW